MKILIPNLRGTLWHWTALLARRSRVRFPIVSLDFFIVIILPATLWSWVYLASNRNDYQGYSWRKNCLGRRAENLIIFFCRLSLNLETEPPGTLKACPGLYRDCFTSTFNFSFNFNFNLQASNLKFLKTPFCWQLNF